MYGSRTDKARGQRMSRSDEQYLRYLGRGRLKGRNKQDEQEAITEQVTAMLDDDEPAMLRDCESVDMNALHDRALKDHIDWIEEQAWEELLLLELAEQADRDEQYDAAYGGYSDDPDDGDHSGCWMPFMRMEELRDTFGENWLGNGFHIIDGNGIRRNK